MKLTRTAPKLFMSFIPIAFCAGVMPNTGVGAEPDLSGRLWRRTGRVVACETPHRARYPSLARNAAGEVVLLFTQASREQEAAGRGDLMMIRSADGGATWSGPARVCEGTVGEPRTMGTLTRLSSNRLIAAVAEIGAATGPERIRLLVSDDDGRTWRAGEPIALPGLKDACPYGRLLEQPDQGLAMAVYGTHPESGRQAAGLLRSADAGLNWGQFSLIAADADRNMTHPALLRTGAETMVAVVVSGEQMFRCESTDAGHTWTAPEQTLLGREPFLFRVDDSTVACLGAKGTGWGHIWIGFGGQNARNWRCDRKVVEHPGEPGGHFGWATGLALDSQTVLVAFGHTRRPVRSLDGPDVPAPPSPEAEGIEVVFFEREEAVAEPAHAREPVAAENRDRWTRTGSLSNNDLPIGFCRLPDGVLLGAREDGDSMMKVWAGPGRGGASAAKYVSGPATTKSLLRSQDNGRTWTREPMNLPPGYRGSPRIVCRLKTGRILCTITEWLLVEWNYEDKAVIGHENGYAIWSKDHHSFHKSRLAVIYSDDNGATWQGCDRDIDYAPFQWAIPNDPVFERADGTVVMPIWGCMNVRDGRERLDAGGLIRSTDGGVTWGDPSLIAHDSEKRWSAYNEAGIAVMSDDLWVAFMRTEYRGVGNEGAWMSRAVTTDGGYTWSAPELSFIGGVPQVVVLPDGGIAVGASGGLHWSYDLGRTWARISPPGGYVHPILLDDNTMIIGNGQRWGGFSVWSR